MTSPTDQYDPNIPQSTDDLATSQGQFLTNFQQLYNAFVVNHVALDAASNAGNHTLIQLISSLQPFNTDAGEISIYAKPLDMNAPLDEQAPQLFMRYQGNQTEVPITNYQLYSIPATPDRMQYFTFLPGKILVYYGMVNINAYPFNLSLNPSIGKNLVTANFCSSSSGSGASSSPIVDPVVAQDGFIHSLRLTSAFGGTVIVNQLMTYLVMVNI